MRGKKIPQKKRDEIKIELLKAGDNPNISEIARIIDMPERTVNEISRNIMNDEAFARDSEIFKKETISKLQELAQAAILVSLDKIDTASSASAATIAAIAIDKSQLLRGEPTIISKEDINASKLSDLDTQMQQLIDKYPHLKGKIS